jgi:hypothetical protein
VGGSTSVPPEPPQRVLLSRLYRFLFHRYRSSVYGLKVGGENVLRFICKRLAYGIPTNPCATPFASIKSPVMTPPALMALASVNVEPGGSNVVMVPSLARRKP